MTKLIIRLENSLGARSGPKNAAEGGAKNFASPFENPWRRSWVGGVGNYYPPYWDDKKI